MSGKQLTMAEKATAAMRSAVRKVIEDHRSRSRPLAVWRDDRVVLVDAPRVSAAKESKVDYGAEEERRDRNDD